MEDANPPWTNLVVICTSCRGSRSGPDGRGIRKGLKRAVDKADGLRVAEVDCLKVCPDDAVAVCVMRLRETSRCLLVSSERDVEKLADSLRGRGTR